MSATTDPKYLQLYHDYARAIRVYENALAERKRVRNLFAVRSSPVLKAFDQWNRRPGGSPAGYRAQSLHKPKQPVQHRGAVSERKIYMGEILGWAKIVGTSPGLPVTEESEGGVDIDKLYDSVSLRLYWNAKLDYQKCKKAFFDYVRGQNRELWEQNLDHHRKQAAEALGHGANMQFLGIDSDDAMAEAKREVEAACRNAWALYHSSPSPKSRKAKVLLLESLADAQLVGLDESSITKVMHQELMRLTSAGEIQLSR